MKLVIVDDVDASRNSILARLNERGIESVSVALAEVEDLADRVNEQKPDCILMDFVLTESGQVRFRSHVLARVLRDRAVDGSGPQVPIVLYSSAPNFKSFYDADQTSHELYDYRFDKEQMQSDIVGAIAVLNGLAAAYKSLALSDCDRSALLSAFARPEGLDFDPRIGDRFTKPGRYPIAQLVGYVMREFIEQPYPLVDRALLGARLGLDLKESAGAEALLGLLPAPTKYTGICSGGFERWWWELVDSWLTSLDAGSFRAVAAEERVAVLRERTGIAALQPAVPIRQNYQTAYWTVCEAYHRPVDLSDAFIASNSSREAWHDHRYISLEAALRHAGEDQGVVVDAADEDRFSQVRDLLGG
jgi:CheY-like chemotaxis protein